MSSPCEESSSENSETQEVEFAYSNRLKALRTKVLTAQKDRSAAIELIVGSATLTAVLFGLALTHSSMPLSFATLPLAGVLYFCRRYIRAGVRWRDTDRRCEFFQRGIRRVTGQWQGEGNTGEEFGREKHLYQWDLNVIGSGSLFQLLCTTRSVLGAERLAHYLLDPTKIEESRLRQEAVRELRDRVDLREEVDLLGDHRSQDCTFQDFEAWLDLAPLVFPPAIPFSLLLSSCISFVIGVGILAKALLWTQWLPFLLILVAFQTGVAGLLYKRVRPRLRRLRLLTNAFTVLHQGLKLIETQSFNSVRLSGLAQRLRAQHASSHLKTLERLARGFDQREKPQLDFPLKLLAVGTQLVLCIDRWRSLHQDDFREWIDAWAEFEALQALAGYAFEHQNCIFPELQDGAPIFEAEGLGHPLLDAKRCVCNNITLNEQSRLYLITGSNMAGKSTLLRTIGLNTVIAFAGGSIPASRARISHLTVCASLAIADSLIDGKSKFLAEVERLSASVSLARSGQSVLFLIDEILSGTNSKDRRMAAETVVRALHKEGALGAISTHDLALAQIVGDPALAGSLVHMESDNPEDPFAFDFTLKPGQSMNSNALAIVRMMGIAELQASV